MKTFLTLCVLLLLLVGSISAAQAQKVIEEKAGVAAGQHLNLHLKQATNIRIHASSGSEVVLRATVTINQGQLNDVFLLKTDRSSEGVTFTSSFDEALLKTSTGGGNCPDGAANWGGNWQNGKQSGSVCVKIEVDVAVPKGVAVQVNTISGNIEMTDVTAPIDAKSISGFVDVSWPAQRGAEVAFKSISGEVYTDQDIAFANHKEHPLVGYQLHGTLGSSGPAVHLESISGDVFFRKQK